MKNYYKLMLGGKDAHADECFKGNFIGVDFQIDIDLEGKLPENWRDFNKKFIPIYLERHPGKSKIAAGLACGTIWTVSKGIKKEDIVLCPTGSGYYLVGEVLGDYSYHSNEILPHRRDVRWLPIKIERTDMSQALQKSSGSRGTYSTLTKHQDEIEQLIEGSRPPTIISTDEQIENPSSFALEKHLEDFLVHNWKQTELGKKYDIFEEEGELIGQQYPTETGPIDILAVSKDTKELIVVELKRGKSSDAVVGQVQRYMGFVQEELAETGQIVKGVIIAAEEDRRITLALKVTVNIEFLKYQVSFKLMKD